MNDRSNKKKYKIVIVGRTSVGKSCLLLRFTDDRFVEDYLSTIGVDFKFRTFKIEDIMFKLQIWDTAGQEKYQTITKTFYKGADAVVIVYDCCSRTSFEEAKKVWLEETRKNCDEKCLIMFIGNKIDQSLNREVTFDDLQDFCKKENILGYETSAKTGESVEKSFFELTKNIYENEKKNDVKKTERQNLDLKQNNQQNNGCC